MKSAVISLCEKFRYRLDRDVEENVALRSFVIAFIGVNPSDADSLKEDPTSRKLMKFAIRENATRFIVGNVYSYRSSKPKVLSHVAATQGPAHHYHLRKIIKEADLLVPCWGSRDKVPKKLHGEITAMINLLRASGKPIRIFGTTASGDPAHPLFLPDCTTLESWG